MTKAGPREGDLAPDFTLPADDGSRVTLSDHRGQRVLLYFYPKDDTSGCTAQACDLRDGIQRFDAADVVVLGVSPDPVESHRKFRDKYDLNFPLLADDGREVAEAYGVWGPGGTFVRSSFLVDEEGRIAKAWRDVDARRHAELVTAYLDV